MLHHYGTQDCDYYYDCYSREQQARKAAQDAIFTTIGQLDQMDSEFVRIRELIAPPAAEVFIPTQQVEQRGFLCGRVR